MINNNLQEKAITVLIVDDDNGQRLLMREAMEHAGLNVTEACNGLEAVETFLERAPDLVLMDVNMPEMDGFTACKKLRELPGGRSVPILMVTGSDDYDSIHEAYESGATDFVQKPINLLLLSYRARYIIRAHHAIDELTVSEAKLENAYKIGKLGSWEWNLETNRFILSEELYQIFGLKPRTFGATYETFLELIHLEDRARIEGEIDAALQMHEPVHLEYRIITPNNSECIVQHEGNFLPMVPNQPLRATGTIQDITSKVKTEKQIKFLAFYDRLTGLPNSFLFKELLGKAITQAVRHENAVAIMCIDIENFKRINDTFGRETGDEILKIVAQRIKESVRGNDVVTRANTDPTAARLAADEFGLILVDLSDLTNAAVIARRLQEIISEAIELDDKEIYLNSRIGISLCPSDGDSVETLIKNADIALSRAKEKGKNTYQFYTSDLNAKAFMRYSTEIDLRKAIEQEEIFCVYQPQVDLSTGDIVGVETLLRWNHPEKGFISPLHIIEIAEETGLIMPIGEFVLRTACRQNMAWQKAGYENIRIAVNLSVAQLRDTDLIKKIEQTLGETGHPAELLELEITESMLMENIEAGIQIIESLHGMGIHMSIDDFGTGYSSLSYLKRFPVRALKIDRSFVDGTPHDPHDNVIVTAIINLGHNLGLEIIAEGVENEEQKKFLSNRSCDTMQGYLISKPVVADEVVSFLRPGNISIACRDR